MSGGVYTLGDGVPKERYPCPPIEQMRPCPNPQCRKMHNQDLINDEQKIAKLEGQLADTKSALSELKKVHAHTLAQHAAEMKRQRRRTKEAQRGMCNLELQEKVDDQALLIQRLRQEVESLKKDISTKDKLIYVLRLGRGYPQELAKSVGEGDLSQAVINALYDDLNQARNERDRLKEQIERWGERRGR